MTPRVLLVGHAADRTGPPIGLLHFLRWLRSEADVEPEVLLLEGGDLEPAYRALAPTVVLDEWQLDPPWDTLATLAEGRARRLMPAIRRRGLARRLAGLRPPDLVYVNTAWTIRALHHLPFPVPRLVVAIHEMEVGLDLHLAPAERELLFTRADHLVAVSDAVRDNLVERHGVAPESVSVHREMIEVRPADPRPSSALRLSLGIPVDAPLVGSAGLVHWRKGADLFVHLAAGVVRHRPDAHVVWVGGDPDDAAGRAMRNDIEAGGLADRVHVVAHVEDPLAWFGAMDVFVLPAREDAFPLVCLEAGSVGVPVVCFDNGGMPELVERGAGAGGYVVPYPDVGAMVDRVVGLLDDPVERRARGAWLAGTVAAENDVSVIAPGLWEELVRWLP